MGRKWKVFTFIKNDPLIEQAIFNSVQNNRLFSIRDECLYFKSDFHKEEVLNLEISLITDFEKLNNIIVKLIEIAHEEIINIKTSQEYEDQDYSIQFSGKIEGIVNGLLHKACYTSISVIDFAIILFVRIARAHAWRNGNKRTSIVSLSKILSLFGFALKWVNTTSNYTEQYEKLVLDIVAPKDKDYEESKLTEQEAIQLVKTKIRNSIWINYNNIR